MKLEVSVNQAFAYSCACASFFVMSVYIWKPLALVRVPYQIKQIRKKKAKNMYSLT